MRHGVLWAALLASVAAAGDGTGALSGRVTDEAGAPCAGAQVYAARNHHPLAPRGERNIDAIEDEVAAVTDEAGRYRVEGLEPGEYHLAAKHGTRAAEYEHPEWQYRQAALVHAGETTPDVDMVLLPSVRVRGRVRDAGGAPVADVSVLAYVEGMAHAFGSSDAEGRYDLPLWPVRKPGVVRVSWSTCREFVFPVDVYLPVRPGADVTVRDVAAQPPARISGVVVEADGSPVAYARVSWWGQEVDTDWKGRFTFAAARPQAADLRVDRGSSALQVPLAPTPGGDLGSVRVVVHEPRTIRGVVTDDRGFPRQWFSVEAEAVAGSPGTIRSVEFTAEDGTFRFGNLQPGRYRLTWGEKPRHVDAATGAEDVHIVVPSAGVLRWTLPEGKHSLDVFREDRGRRLQVRGAGGDDDDGWWFECREPGTYRLCVEPEGHAAVFSPPAVVGGGRVVDLGAAVLRRPGTLQGVVRTPEGAPLPDAQVHAVDATGALYGREVFTDPRGRFAYGGLPPGRYTLLAVVPGRPPAFVTDVALEEGAEVVADIVAPAAAAITDLRVRDAAGGVPGYARIVWRPAGLPVFVGTNELDEPRSYGDPWIDAEGRVRKPLLPPGHVTFAVATSDDGPFVAECTVDLEAGKVSTVEITLP